MNKKVSMNKMGVVSIKKLMLMMGMPMIVSMVLQALYNIVDSYFVSCIAGTESIPNMGEYAVNALTLAFPIQMLMIAIGVGTGVGVNALLSRYLGQGDTRKASCIAGNAIFLGICTYIVFLVFGIVGIKAYIGSQTSNKIISTMGESYLRICTVLSFSVILFMIYEKLLQATGKTMLSTIAQIAGALTNIILDPVMIFGWWGCPKLGIEGAAYATIIGQSVSWILNMTFHYKFNKEIDGRLKFIKPQKEVIYEIYKVGLPAIVMQALMSFMTYGANIILGFISSTVVTAYGIYYKVQQFVFFAAFGMNNAMIPIIGFNYGKKDKKRIGEGIKYGMVYTLIIMAIGAVVLWLFAYQIIGTFAISGETQGLCIDAIHIITLGYLFVGANIAYQGIFQALGCGVRSLVISLIRLIIIPLPIAFLFTRLPIIQGLVWSAFPIGEAVALIIGSLLMKQVSKEKLSEISEVKNLNQEQNKILA